MRDAETPSGEKMGAVPAAEENRSGSWAEMGDEALVERAQDGEVGAFEVLYRRLVDRIYGLCLRMSRDPVKAEELTQDVWVRAWERLGSFRAESRFSTWLHRVAVNVVLQAGRSESRKGGREESLTSVDGYLAVAREVFPGTRVDLERAIAALPDGARQVLVLRDIYGYPYAEIAELQGVALGTVKAQIHRARRMMREKLER